MSIISDDMFVIDEVTMFEGENWSDKTYAVAGDILDGYLYDLFMNMLDEFWKRNTHDIKQRILWIIRICFSFHNMVLWNKNLKCVSANPTVYDEWLVCFWLRAYKDAQTEQTSGYLSNSVTTMP